MSQDPSDSPIVQNHMRQALPLTDGLEPESAWTVLRRKFLKKEMPFETHASLFQRVYRNWDTEKQGPPPAWSPDPKEAGRTNISEMIRKLGLSNYDEFFRWSVENREQFWKQSIEACGVQFVTAPERYLDPDSGVENPTWLPGANLNMAQNCFNADPGEVAVVYQKEGASEIETMTYARLDRYSNQIANSLGQLGYKPGDRIAIDMVMTVDAVAIYLGIVKAGCVAVSIADSFSSKEIETRLKISKAKAIFTQDVIIRAGKTLPLYDKVKNAFAPRAIVLPAGESGELTENLREDDLSWKQFLVKKETYNAVPMNPQDESNILFSSGTTGDPKAIPWTHLSPIKSAVDGYYHHDIKPGDVVAWPTNLGWMMGPWLIYASLVNKGTMALYYGAPTGSEFGKFVEEAKVNMLGLVPSIVKAWRASGCMADKDWSSIKCFSSTGEVSNADDYLFLMSLANYRPVIEYCGGTEIGGGYITGTLVQPASPSTFSTPALGIDLVLLNEEGKPVGESGEGEVYLIPPSIGLSQTLLNRDHHEIYFEGTPKGPNGEILRRHGDQMCKLGAGFYRAQGRADDTMNLGGIKVSSAEIERVLNQVDGVTETAAIAVNPPGGGPSELVIYAVMKKQRELAELQKEMQSTIKSDLNPLFKISKVKVIEALPRTASNKVMRRKLRDAESN